MNRCKMIISLDKDEEEKNKKVDLYNYIENEDMINKQILIIGCGLSDHNSFELKIGNMLIYSKLKGLTFSDINCNYNLSTCWLRDYIPKFPALSIFSDAIKTRFLKLDILNNVDLDSIGNYDYFELRYVLHFTEFKSRRLNIIKKLYSKLNEGGVLGIQIYYELDNNRKDKDMYSTITDDEISEISKKYKCEINQYVENDNIYKIILIYK